MADLGGMVNLLREEAGKRGLVNLEALLMAPNTIDLPGDIADFIVMGQLHHVRYCIKP